MTKWQVRNAIEIQKSRAMVFGGTGRERIQLNEDTLWSGGPRDTTNPEALKHLPEVRRLLFDGRPDEAVKVAQEHLMGRPMRIKPYQSLGDLRLDFPGHEAAEDYRREYNTIRPHEALAFNRPQEVHLGLADPKTPTFQTKEILPTT